MLNEKELPFLAEKGHIVSLVGGGGKTTLLYAMADHCARKGWRVVVMTTTHIRQSAAYYAPDDAALTTLWQAGHYAVIGTPAENGKLTDIILYFLIRSRLTRINGSLIIVIKPFLKIRRRTRIITNTGQ